MTPKDENELYKLTDAFIPAEDPSGCIQWKGTQLCMDAYCACGEHFHVDGEFVYYVRCPYCKTVLALNQNIQLIPVGYEPDGGVHEAEKDS